MRVNAFVHACPPVWRCAEGNCRLATRLGSKSLRTERGHFHSFHENQHTCMYLRSRSSSRSMALNLANNQRRDSYRCIIQREDLVRWLPRKKTRCGRLNEFIPTAEKVSSKVDTPVYLILTVFAQASLLFGNHSLKIPNLYNWWRLSLKKEEGITLQTMTVKTVSCSSPEKNF